MKKIKTHFEQIAVEIVKNIIEPSRLRDAKIASLPEKSRRPRPQWLRKTHDRKSPK